MVNIFATGRLQYHMHTKKTPKASVMVPLQVMASLCIFCTHASTKEAHCHSIGYLALQIYFHGITIFILVAGQLESKYLQQLRVLDCSATEILD